MNLDAEGFMSHRRSRQIVITPGSTRLEDEVQPPGVGHQLPEIRASQCLGVAAETQTSRHRFDINARP